MTNERPVLTERKPDERNRLNERTRPARFRFIPVAAVAVAMMAVGLLATSGCSDSERSSGVTASDSTTSTTAPGKRITAEQASRLADVLVANHDAGGARVRATIPYGRASFDLAGEIDWAKHIGRVTVTPTVDGTPETPFDIAFSPTLTFEEVPGLEQAMAARGRPGIRWVARALDPATSPLHLPLRLIDTAASTQRDNPVLLQSNGTTFAGTSRVGDVATEIYDTGRVRVWMGVDDRRTQRIEADLAATDSTATIDFDEFGPRVIDVPSDDEIVAYSEVADLYRELVGS